MKASMKYILSAFLLLLSEQSFPAILTYQITGYFFPGGGITGDFKETFSYDTEQPLLRHAAGTIPAWAVGVFSSGSLELNGVTTSLRPNDIDALQYSNDVAGDSPLLSILGRLGDTGQATISVQFSFPNAFSLDTGIPTDNYLCNGNCTFIQYGQYGPTGSGVVTSFSEVPLPSSSFLLSSAIVGVIFRRKHKTH